jgi:Tol biopolymer transport system component
LRFAAIVAVICALGVATPSALAQQSVDVGSVSGRVTDQSGAVVTDAQVTARQTQTNLTTTATTDQDGRFRLPYLRFGPCGVSRDTSAVTGAANFAFSSTGSLVYVRGPVSASALLDIGLMDRAGKVEPLRLPPGTYEWPRVSPDGKRLAVASDDDKEATIWIYDLSGTRAMQRLTSGGNNRFPIWSSDSKRVAFQSDRDGDVAIFWQPADGGVAERLTRPVQGESHTPESWSPKGDRFLFTITKGSDVSLWTFSLQDRKATPFGAVHSSNPTNAAFSPDANWVAYASTERSIPTIYVQPFPATRPPMTASSPSEDRSTSTCTMRHPTRSSTFK